jgi:DNA-binding transcriptional LysR family regulator
MVDLDTRLLRAFVTVAEELNFTRAAERMHLAQQALSAQIRQLESRLGTKLFERTTRKVALTEAGELLLPHAAGVLTELDAGIESLRAASRAERATLRVGLSGTATVPVVSETRPVAERHTRSGAAFSFWHPRLVTVSVWLWSPNPSGLFASTNPAADYESPLVAAYSAD